MIISRFKYWDLMVNKDLMASSLDFERKINRKY